MLAAYHRSTARNQFIMGPLGSGKTIETCQKIFLKMCHQAPNPELVRPTRWYAVRNTYSDLLTTTVKDWLDLFGELGHYSEGSKKPPMHELDFLLEDNTRVKAELIFLALDRDDHVKKLRGAQATGFWLNEVKELVKPIVDMADLRHGRYPSMASGGVRPTWHGMFGDTNAPDEDHWYYEMAEETPMEDWEFFRQPGGLLKVGKDWVENPEAENLHNLPEGYYIKGMQNKKEDWIKVNLGNQYGFVMDGKPVYPDYNDLLHVNENIKPIPGLPIERGWDFGLTPACIFSQLTPEGRWIIFDELIATRMGAENFSEEVILHSSQKYPGFEFNDTGDPSGESAADTDETSCFEILQGKGIDIEGGLQAPEIRIESVAKPLRTLVGGKPQLQLHPRCKILRKGFLGGYHFRKKRLKEERYDPKPDKNGYSHPHDGLQYTGTKLFADQVKGYEKKKPKNQNQGHSGPRTAHGWMSA